MESVLILEMAGIRVMLDPIDAVSAEFLRANLRDFIVPEQVLSRAHPDERQPSRGAPDDVLLHVSVAHTPDDRAAPSSDVDVSAPSPSIRIVRRVDIEGTIDLSRNQGSIVYSGGGPSLLSCLRVFCSLTLASNGGFLMHASSVVSGGRAFLFVGPSGTGKTTIARLGAPRGVLSDEISAVRWRDGKPWCFPPPFWGEMERVKVAAATPLGCVFFPKQSHEVAIFPSPFPDSLARLLHCAVYFGSDPGLENQLIETCIAVVRSFHCKELRFKEEPSFWRTLDEVQDYAREQDEARVESL
jgi:hypothetical protein